MSKCKDILNELIVTCCFVGKIKYAPGTFGSLVAFPLSYVIFQLALITTVVIVKNDFNFFIFFGLISVAIIVPFIIGVRSSNFYINRTGKHDPKEIVIDEVVGQMLTIFLCLPSITFLEKMGTLLYNIYDPKVATEVFICLFIMPFALFRFFDIKKPWPIDWMDKNIKGGFGVMIDDIAAAIFASVIHYALIFVWLDWTR